MNIKTLSTSEVAEATGISYGYIQQLLCARKIFPLPEKVGGRYQWDLTDIDSLCQLIHKKPFEEYLLTLSQSPEVQCL